MDLLAPPVVAVVIAHEPGSWFAETLASLAAQDYDELSVLVLGTGSSTDLAQRVAEVLPSAYVRVLDENNGFGATANEVRTMVEGAAYYLFLHDDVALDPDAVHLMVEEAFRSNAGVVSPKVVSWSDPERLVHVGMTVDHTGSVVERVQPFEIDHGQHDAVRDVFVAPGGCTLVRADLFAELDGFDPAIVAMGEDLDFCWRAQLVGARVIVCPDARVRHRESLASGEEELRATLTTETTLQELQRRHELLVVLKCSSTLSLVWLLPQMAVLALAEIVVARLSGNPARARAVARAWRWNLARRGELRTQRTAVQDQRRLSDRELRTLQVGGNARVSAYIRRVFAFGFQGAHEDELGPAQESDDPTGPLEEEAADRGRLQGRTRLLAWTVAGLLALIGTRGLVTSSLPSVGQFVPFPSWTSTWSAFLGGWHPSGVGTTAPSSPALLVVGVVSTALFGAMGLTEKVLVLACLPLGVLGAVRLTRPFGSQRASMVTGLSYLAMALPYNALAQGRWQALVVYGGAPWLLLRLFRATDLAPYGSTELPTPAEGAGERWTSWSLTEAGLRPVLSLGALLAVMVAFVPAAWLVAMLAALGLGASSLFFGDWAYTRRAFMRVLAATLVAAVVLLPWLIGTVVGGFGAVFGVQTSASSAASWGSLLRFSVGPIGGSWLAFGFVIAGAAPLVLAKGKRFQWSTRFWTIALLFWVVAWLMQRDWTGGFFVEPLVLLVPAAVLTAAAIGMGVTAFERDLWAAQFGWRQVLSVVAVGAAALAALPTLVSALPGRWELPTNAFAQSVQWMSSQPSARTGGFRVLWLGDPRALNQGGWSAGDGLAYATSDGGPPDARWLWNAASSGPAGSLAADVALARAGTTNQLGHLLAAAGVRYVAVLTGLAPEITGEQSPETFPVPTDLLPGLEHQLDLSTVVNGTGITVFANTAWTPVRSSAGQPVLTGQAGGRSASGVVPRGELITALSPADQWSLTGATRQAGGWQGRYLVPVAGRRTLAFHGGLLGLLSWLFSVTVWAALAFVLVARRRWGDPKAVLTGWSTQLRSVGDSHADHAISWEESE